MSVEAGLRPPILACFILSVLAVSCSTADEWQLPIKLGDSRVNAREEH